MTHNFLIMKLITHSIRQVMLEVIRYLINFHISTCNVSTMDHIQEKKKTGLVLLLISAQLDGSRTVGPFAI